MNYRLVLFALLLICPLKIKAQQQIGLPNVVLPSPTAMQFQKHGDYPVGHFTGVPSISIPLYTIKEGDLEIPVTMDYRLYNNVNQGPHPIVPEFSKLGDFIKTTENHGIIRGMYIRRFGNRTAVANKNITVE